MVCKTPGVDAHHPRRAVTGQPRGLGAKSCGDDLAVPLCRTHHMMCHTYGDELDFWLTNHVDPIAWSEKMWSRWKLKNTQ